MTLAQLLVAIGLLPQAAPDRNDPRVPVVRDRLAQGVLEACAITDFPGGRGECQAYVLTVGSHESHFALNVQAGSCRRYQCDPMRLRDGTVYHRARSWWQGHQNSTPIERYDAIVGLSQEAISQAAILAAERLRSSRLLCDGAPDVVRATLASYGGRGCRGTLPDMAARVATFRRVRARL